MDSSRTASPTRRRSKAWIYYTFLAIVSLIVTCAGHPAAIVGTLLCAAYAVYLHRGGRIVVWFW